MNIFLRTQFIQFLLISPVRKQEGIFPFIRSEEIVPIHSLKAPLVLGTEQKVGGFFSIWVFFHEHSQITGLQGKGEGISLTPHYHFHPLHRHLDISRAITAESSPLRIASSRTQTGNLWFPSASH